MTDTIIFIYNAKSGLLAGLSDAVTKIVAPSQYECNLCKITYGPLSMKEEWAQFLATLPQEKVFLHKDELIGQYEALNNYALPTIFLKHDNRFSLLVSKDKLNTLKSVMELKYVLKSALTST